MSNDSFDGSQAFNRISSAIEDVIPNSGSLLLNVPIVDLIGVQGGIGLQIDLGYSLGAAGTLGLPPNWSFGIPSLVPGDALSINGMRYIVDPAWTDSTGYASGLKYENNHGIAFVDNVVSQNLPYGQFGAQYQFSYTCTDGCAWYFDSTGALLMKADRFGNYLYYAYTPGQAGNVLDYIIDSFGQKTTFGYGAGQIVVTLPDGRRVTINCDTDAVHSVVDPLGDTTTFTSTLQCGFSVVSSIAYPTGKTTNVGYTSIGFIGSDGGSYDIPAVSDLYFMDPDNKLLAHYQYAYGTQSGGNTFTGANAGYRIASDSDGLLDSNNNAYVYDVQVRTLNQADTILALTTIFYNFAHVPLEQDTYVIDADGVQSGYQQTKSVYDISQDVHNQQPNYLSPKQTQRLFVSLSSQAGVPQSQVAYEYDDFGNTTFRQTSSYDIASRAYVPALTEKTAYFTQGATITTLVETATQTDNVTNKALRTVNTRSTDMRSIVSSVVSCSSDGGATWSGWKARQQALDAQGRETSATLSWVATGVPGVQETSSRSAYAYDAAAFAVTKTITDARGFVSTHVVSTMHGHKLSETAPSGARTAYAYDPIGRLVSKTSPSGHETTHVYKTYASGGENSATKTTPMGYMTKTINDPLGRKIATCDNGNPGNAQQWRTLSQLQYDVLGNVVREADVFGNVTTGTYNSLGKPTLSVDPLGNRRSIAYDYSSNTTTTSLNGIALTMVAADNFGRPVVEETYPNTLNPDKTAQYTSRRVSAYDGFGNLQAKTASQVIAGIATVLHARSYQYDAEGERTQETFTGADGSVRQVRSVYDLNKKKISHTKTVTYAGGGTYTVPSDVCLYDARGQLLTLTNRAGQVESYVHNGDHHLVSKKLFDGSVIDYDYSSDGKKKRESWTEAGAVRTVSYHYDHDGHLLSTSDASGAVSNTYSLDGVLTSIAYPDGRKITYALDQYSRKVGQTDVSGATTTYAYTAQNQLLGVTTAQDTLTYAYYADTSMNALIGAPQSVTLANNYTETYRYDAHGRKNATQRVALNGVLLLGESSVYNAIDKVTATTLKSELTASQTVNCQRAYSYDAFGQLTGDTVTGGNGQPVSAEAFRYDGNGNVLQKTGPAAGETTVYTYNEIDQLTTYTRNGAARMQAYDANGRLVADGNDNTYAYDVPGKLLSVKGARGTTRYTYYPNDLLATRTSAASTVGMYYDNLQQVVNTAQAGTPTRFLMVGSRRFASYRAGAPAYYYGVNQRQDTVLGCNAAAGGGQTLVGSASYASYGARTDLSVGMDATNDFGWSQEYADVDDGLVYLRARYYDPGTMRFVSRDSKRLDNRYSFGNADPVNHVDPSGHDAREYVEIGVGVGAGVVIAGAAVYFAVTYGAAVAAAATVATAAVGGGGVLAGILSGTLAAAGALGLGAGAGTAGAIAGGVGLVAAAGLAIEGTAVASVGGTVGAVIGLGLGTYATGSATVGAIGGIVGGLVGTATESLLGTAASYASAAVGTTIGYASTAVGTAAGYASSAVGTAVGYVGTAGTIAAETSVAATELAATAATMAVEAVSGAAAAVGAEGLADLALLALAAFLF